MESWGCEFLDFENHIPPSSSPKDEHLVPIELIDKIVDKNIIANITQKDRWYINELKAQILREGFLQPGLIVFGSNGVILKDGNHRYIIAKEIGEKFFKVKFKSSSNRIRLQAAPLQEFILGMLEYYSG